MRRTLLAAASLAALAAPVLAADLGVAPAPVLAPAFSWTGIYIGANAGYGVARATAAGFTTSDDVRGAIAGGQTGNNYQIGVAVLGIEGDAQWSGQSRSVTQSCGFGCTISGTDEVNLFSTFRARVGLAVDRVLFYATAGGAWQSVSTAARATALGATAAASVSGSGYGWTAGGGIEWAFAPHWSVKTEYLYLSTDATARIAGTDRSVRVENGIARAGVNYRF